MFNKSGINPYCAIISTICLCIFIAFMSEFLTITSYDKTLCYITDVSTPTQLPTINNKSGWIRCYCGRKHCHTYTPCTKISVNITNGKYNVMLMRSTINTDDICTYRNRKCSHNIIDTVQRMNHMITVGDHYRSLLNQSKPIVCYTNSDRNEAYLYNEMFLNTILWYCIPFGLCLIGYIIYKCKEKRKNRFCGKNTVDISNTTKNKVSNLKQINIPKVV